MKMNGKITLTVLFAMVMIALAPKYLYADNSGGPSGPCTTDCSETWTSAVFADYITCGTNTCEIDVHYSYRVACSGTFNDVYISYLELAQSSFNDPCLACFVQGMKTSALLDQVEKDLLAANPMGFTLPTPGHCVTNWRLSKSSCWASYGLPPWCPLCTLENWW